MILDDQVNRPPIIELECDAFPRFEWSVFNFSVLNAECFHCVIFGLYFALGASFFEILANNVLTIEPKAGRNATIYNASDIVNPAATRGDLLLVLALYLVKVHPHALVIHLDLACHLLRQQVVLDRVLFHYERCVGFICLQV